MLKQDVDAGIAFIAQNTGMNQQQTALQKKDPTAVGGVRLQML